MSSVKYFSFKLLQSTTMGIFDHFKQFAKSMSKKNITIPEQKNLMYSVYYINTNFRYIDFLSNALLFYYPLSNALITLYNKHKLIKCSLKIQYTLNIFY